MNPFIYFRGLRHADHAVFCVEGEQKSYWDKQFRTKVAYSSGQQIKRSILEEVLAELNEMPAAITFYSEATITKSKTTIKEKEVTSPGDPSITDQLLGGWMIAKSGGNSKSIKRRSPLSISAMRPLHPLLANVHQENLSFDRSDRPDHHKIIVKDTQGNVLSDEEITTMLDGSDRSLRRKWIQGKERTTGLFVYDVAIDLRTLFCVSTNQTEPEITAETIELLKEKGWIESTNTFGKCLVAPKETRDKIIPVLAKSLINWRIKTNQARTYTPMEVLATAISDNANLVTGAIRAKLIDEGEKPSAKPVVDDNIKNVDVFVNLPGAAYFNTNVESAEALDASTNKLIETMQAFDYENQV